MSMIFVVVVVVLLSKVPVYDI